MIGQPSAGSAVGHSLGAAISKWLGAGDYTVAKNTLVQRAASGIPMMHNSGQSTTIRHREFITQVNGTVGFNVQRSIILNPGLASSFPWLSGIARNYQEYEWKGLVFHFVPTSGTAVSNTSAALGTVMLQTSYRSTDAPPESKIEMMNEFWANEVVPFDSMCHPIECSPKENPFNVHYVRSGNAVGEPLMYDLGVTYLATQGQQSAYAVGDLWVTYEVELKKPIVSSNATNVSDLSAASFTLSTPSTPFPNTPPSQVIIEGTLPITYTPSGRINVPPGYPGTFYVAVTVIAGSTFSAASWQGPPVYTNAAGKSYPSGFNALGQTIAGATATATTLVYQIAFSPVDSSAASVVNLPTPSWTGTAAGTLVTVIYVA